MATFNYIVDTHPMAQEMGSVSNNVKVTTGAVVAMQTAVVLAEAKAADAVCDNVNKGFYTLIRSQISQKIARLQSQVDSHLMQLNQQKKQLLAIKGRMERDYNMISGRYLKLFNSLNSNLKQRVFELEKPVTEFAVRDIEKVSNRSKQLTATIPVSQLESLTISQKILASNLKFKGVNVIHSMTKFIRDINTQKEVTDRILLHGNEKNATLYVPIVISEANYDKYNNKSVEVTLCKTHLSNQSQIAIKNSVISCVDGFEWKEVTDNEKEIQNEFMKISTSYNASQRVKEMANKLFLASSYQTI